jgi:hypothetical protein
MNKIIYYHYFCTDKSLDILSAMVDEILESDLYDNINEFHINIVGETAQKHADYIQKKIADKLSKIKLHQYIDKELREYMDSFSSSEIKNNHTLSIGKAGLELDTLKLMHNQIHASKTPEYILYIHGKGSVNFGRHKFTKFNNREEWRLQMSNDVIANWRKCQKDLEVKPHTGSLFRKNHYSGNFWWAKKEFLLKNLCPIKYAKLNRLNDSPQLNSPFYSAEFWLLNANFF